MPNWRDRRETGCTEPNLWRKQSGLTAATIDGAHAKDPRRLIDQANVAVLRPAESRGAWTGFYRSVREAQISDSN